MDTRERTALLYGQDPTERIVAVERVDHRRVRVFRREADGHVSSDLDEVTPWLVTTRDAINRLKNTGRLQPLDGDLPLNYKIEFDSWGACRDATTWLRDHRIPNLALRNPVDQYLVATGRTLFKGMVFDDLVRLQIDIEGTGLDPTKPGSKILVVALTTNRGHAELLHQQAMSEPEILTTLTERVRELDPDVIEGHNIFNFDLMYLMERARQLGVPLAWGRDGSPPVTRGTQRFKVGPRSVPFQAVTIFGRHIIDTYQQIQRYDVGNELLSYGLKESVEALGLTRRDRVFLPGDKIATTWEQDPDRVLTYALDDVRDVALLSDLTTPTEFYQSQILPRSYQNIAVGGPGEKINVLLARVYLALGHSLPAPETPQSYPGGYTELRRTGVFTPIVKCDVESLYPAIMLSDRIAPRSDVLGVYLDLLQVLTAQRLDAKRQVPVTAGAERARWLGLQSSFKVLINSFYGYLGYSRALFSDYDAAGRVTIRGQEIIRQVVDELDRAGADVIEIDTDGVYFRPPVSVTTPEAEEEFIAQIGTRLPIGISLAHDGSFRGMISLKTKNYVLITHEDRVVLRGSSLRSRRDERIFRRFFEQAALRYVDQSPDAVRELYFDLAKQIIGRRVDPGDIARWETITEKTFTSGANRRFADVATGERIGERVVVYAREDGTLGRLEDYERDEDVEYLLRRLHHMAGRFRPLYDDEAHFRHQFPELTSRSDLARLRAAPSVRQPSLFDLD